MKKFFVGMTAVALMSTCFTVGAFADGLNKISVNKPVKMGAFQEQQGATIEIGEDQKDSWGEEFSFELKLPSDVNWNKKTSVNSMYNVKYDKNSLIISGKANPNLKDSIFIVPYFDIDRKAEKGDLTVLIKSDMKGDIGETVKVGEISDYAVSMTSSFKKSPINSKHIPVELILSEDIENSLVDGAIYTININNGATIDPDTFKIKSLKGFDEFEVRDVKEGYVELKLNKKRSNKNKWQINFDITPKVGFTGEINASIEGRGVDNDSTTIAKIYQGLDFTTRKPDVLSLGKVDQKISDVVINETMAGGLEKGDYTLRLEPAYKGFEFTKASMNTVEGNLRVSSPTIKGNQINFRIKGDSTEASQIQIGDIEGSLDSYGYDGIYKLELVNDKTPNEVIASLDLFEVNPQNSKNSVKFVIGDKNYKVFEGTEVKNDVLDAAPYITGGRTMLPLRAVASSLDVNVDWNSKTQTVTLTSKDKNTVVVTIGKDTMIVDGKEVKLDAVPVIKSSRTFLPVRAISEAFKAEVKWNESEKSVTVEK